MTGGEAAVRSGAAVPAAGPASGSLLDAALGPAARAAGHRLVAFETIGSTNTEAMARARAGDPGPLWLVAGEQTAGRGRRGRAWSTVRGNMAATLLATTTAPAATAATLGFVAGLAAVAAVGTVASRAGVATGPLALKWPNDLYWGDAKLAGILIEAEPVAPGRLAVAIGIGLNVVAAPAGLPYPATALAEVGIRTDAAAVFGALAEAWPGLATTWDEGRGLAAILSAWLARARGLGKPVTVTAGDTRRTGIFAGLDDEGRLVLVDPDGRRHTIAAGEVHFGTGPAPA